MALFSKKPVPPPTIRVTDIDVQFDVRSTTWSFHYRDVDFVAYVPALVMPSREALDELLAAVEQLGPEMRKRLTAGWAHEPLAKLDDGETVHINLGGYGEAQSFDVSWSGGASWGDMGVDFTVRDGVIVGEAWGD